MKLMVIWKGFAGKLFIILHGTFEIAHRWAIDGGLSEVQETVVPGSRGDEKECSASFSTSVSKAGPVTIRIFTANYQG